MALAFSFFAAAPLVAAAWKSSQRRCGFGRCGIHHHSLSFSLFLFFFHCAVGGIVVEALVFFCFAAAPFVAAARQGCRSDVMVRSLRHSLPQFVFLFPFFTALSAALSLWR